MPMPGWSAVRSQVPVACSDTPPGPARQTGVVELMIAGSPDVATAFAGYVAPTRAGSVGDETNATVCGARRSSAGKRTDGKHSSVVGLLNAVPTLVRRKQ